ncbi:MAG: hypothetical protein IPG99_03705 [Ignavibacteria bacterium]|nr:hypothetical protein [Ignavibacteria bacterium]
MKFIFKWLLIIGLISYSSSVRAQVEMVGIGDPVYQFLKEMQVSGHLKEYNSSLSPISRRSVAGYLKHLNDITNELSSSSRSRLNYFTTEFEYDLTGMTNKQNRLLLGPINLNDDRNTNLYFHTDSSVAFFAGVNASTYYRNNSDVPDEFANMMFGNAGLSAQATLFDQVGIMLHVQRSFSVGGDSNSNEYVPFFFPEAVGKDGFRDQKEPYYYDRGFGNFSSEALNEEIGNTRFTGYLRYSTVNEWFSLLVGRTASSYGFGYIDKLFLSDNAEAFDAAQLELKYKSVNYRFSYGSIAGDSIGIYGYDEPFQIFERELSSKNIVSHYLGINFSQAFRIGLWESVVISEQPFSFTYFNPVSFLTSADLSSGDESTTKNNAILGIEMEVTPVRNISFQASLLIDDLTFGTLFEDDSLNENKFGWQIGAMWTALPGVALSLEYTHLDPFVYSHRSNTSSFTNRGYSLGHALPPNSDEIALQLQYNPTPDISANFTYRHQRSADGVLLDENGTLKANYGGYINYGLGDAYLRTNNFLDGNRINRDYFILNASYQFIRQFYFQTRLEYRYTDKISEGRTVDDFMIDLGVRFDL